MQQTVLVQYIHRYLWQNTMQTLRKVFWVRTLYCYSQTMRGG